jgi:peptide chain release factor 2
VSFSVPSFLKFDKHLNPSGGLFDTPVRRKRILEIEAEMESNPTFWAHAQHSATLLKEKKTIEETLVLCSTLLKKLEDLELAIEFGEQGDVLWEREADASLKILEQEVKTLETRKLLCGTHDTSPAIVTVHAGAGGTEACDWAQMIVRMILRFCDKKKFSVHIVDELAGEDAGIKNLTMTVEGPYAYGLLKSEKGVHRLVRISPFDSNARRHTSFCAVSVTPAIDDHIHIELKDSDLKVDTYRAGGAGGQHVNRTDSAVRITHLPSGIVVQSQQQRSQIQNRETCLKLLKSKLYEAELNKRQAESQAQEEAKMDNAFGSQIRSYVLHPYQLVKDLRTLAQSSHTSGVLDGDLDDFVLEYLRQRAAGYLHGKDGEISKKDEKK